MALCKRTYYEGVYGDIDCTTCGFLTSENITLTKASSEDTTRESE